MNDPVRKGDLEPSSRRGVPKRPELDAERRRLRPGQRRFGPGALNVEDLPAVRAGIGHEQAELGPARWTGQADDREPDVGPVLRRARPRLEGLQQPIVRRCAGRLDLGIGNGREGQGRRGEGMLGRTGKEAPGDDSCGDHDCRGPAHGSKRPSTRCSGLVLGQEPPPPIQPEPNVNTPNIRSTVRHRRREIRPTVRPP